MSSNEGLLSLNSLDSMWWSDFGSHTNLPVVMLHAGPGGKSNPLLREIFDSNNWRIIQYDQRACGQSVRRPSASDAVESIGCVRDNATDDLIADLELLREHLGIERWAVFGQSWGTALAVAYAQRFPDRVLGLMLSAVYLGDSYDIKWFFDGPKAHLPEAYEALIAPIPVDEREDLLKAYFARIFSRDPAISIAAARAFMEYDLWLVFVFPDIQERVHGHTDLELVTFARIFLHYLANSFFLGDGVLLGNMHRIVHLPCRIVMGRYDLAVSLRPAWELHRSWPGSSMRIVSDGAYSPYQPAMNTALKEEAILFFKQLKSA